MSTTAQKQRRPSSSPDNVTYTQKSKRKKDFIEPPENVHSKKERILSSATRIYVIPDKLGDDDVDSLRMLITSLGGMNSSISFANLILTALKAPKRAQRYLDSDIQARRVPVVHLSWLYDTARLEILQQFEPYIVVPGGNVNKLSSPSVSASPKTDRTDGAQDQWSDQDNDSISSEMQLHYLEKDRKNAPPWQNTEYACLRPTPLKSEVNQKLVDQLEILRLQRVLAGNQEYNATAYGRAISAIKAYPFPLDKDPANARNIKGVGSKIVKLIIQYYEEGRIAEVDAIKKDDAFIRMTKFMDLYGIGPKRARELYSEGARTLDDVIRMGNSLSTHLHIDDCLKILPDLLTKISRTEVEEIGKYIQSALDTIKPGCVHTICGGFRRGKSKSNDVDIVITDPSPDGHAGQITMMEDLLRLLKKKAFLTHVVNVTTPSSKYEPVFCRLDIAEIVVLPPASKTTKIPRHRRVDIIIGPHKTYGAAILGWTGSRQFERDLRLLAKHRGYKFHSTGLILEGEEQKPLETPREEDVFEILRIPYMPPSLRNCDA